MIDLSNDRKSVEIQILGFIRKGQIVPYRVLQHYNHILNAQAASSGSNGPGTSSGGGTATGGSTDSTTIAAGINDSEANDYLRDLNNEVTNFNTFVQSQKSKTPDNIISYSGSITNVFNEIIPSNVRSVDLIVQNVGDSPFTLAFQNVSSVSNGPQGITIPPQGVITFTGFSSEQSFEARTEAGVTDSALFFAYRVEELSQGAV